MDVAVSGRPALVVRDRRDENPSAHNDLRSDLSIIPKYSLRKDGYHTARVGTLVE